VLNIFSGMPRVGDSVTCGADGRYGSLKHQAIDQARDMASQSRHALLRFGNELKDVYKDLEFQINVDIEEIQQICGYLF
jgi:hypothetical protein